LTAVNGVGRLSYGNIVCLPVCFSVCSFVCYIGGSVKNTVVVPAHSRNALILGWTILICIKCVTNRQMDMLMIVQTHKGLHADMRKNKQNSLEFFLYKMCYMCFCTELQPFLLIIS